MKKSTFITLILGTISGILFALGMCMTLLPEWNSFTSGIILGVVGIVMGIATLLIWCKMEKKELPRINGKNLWRVIYCIASMLVLGVGMCLCLVGQQYLWGTLVGLAGILMLLGLIPMIKGLK